jgi:hypothetical protein
MPRPGIIGSALSNTFENLGILAIAILYLSNVEKSFSGYRPITFTNSWFFFLA